MSSQSIIIDHQARGASTNYPLKQDVLQGFREAVTNNQPTLAMEYMKYIVDDFLDRIAALEAKEVKPATPAKRAIAGKKVEDDESE